MVLHLANGFSGSTVYKKLISELDNKGLKQTVYIPVKTAESIGKNNIKLNVGESSIIYSNILNKHFDRVFYKYKINKILKDIKSKIQISTVNCIHAHTWYSDGGVAYELNKTHNIPYIIAIRSTDVNLFWQLPYLKNYGLKILKNAKKVIFISEAYKVKVLLNTKIHNCIKYKYDVIPNGVDDFWIRNSIKKEENNIDKHINILYVGTFIKRKNPVNLIKAVINLNKKYNNVKLSFVGGGGREQNQVLNLINENPSTLKYYDKILDKNELLGIYRKHQIFAMPSISETFGLVYIEALLQGLPILYTKNEGVDGMYGKEIGEAVENSSMEEIALKLTKLIDNFNSYDYNIEEVKKNHDWRLISDRYLGIYSQCI